MIHVERSGRKLQFWERPRSPLPWLLAVLAVFWLLPLAACGGSSSFGGPTVSVLDDTFSPSVLHINVGQTVSWINNGQTVHTVTADDNSYDSGNFNPGATYQHTYTKAGRYPYYCKLHGGSGGVGMAGVIIVDSASTPASGTGTGYLPRLPQSAHGSTLRVPESYPTIQAAVNAAHTGDMVSIAPGVYHEAVMVRTANVTLRGRDRNAVILDGGYNLDDGVEAVANNVVVENMTARHYVGNGFYWTGVVGFRGSYLTAYANGDYGIYTYNASVGQFDHSYARGQPDSGFYIGDCHPCHALISNVISEDNGLGYSGTNAGGDLVIRDSIWRDNMSGIAPNTLDSEPNPPEDGTTITNNLVENNNNLDAPAKVLEYPTIGNGIVIGGGNNNVITNNHVNGHTYYGIVVIPNIDKNLWEPSGNIVKNNIVTNSGVADLALSALSAGNNCFSDNTIGRTSPPFLQFTHACGSLFAHAGAGDPSVTTVLFDHFMQANFGRYTVRDWRKVSAPAPQPGMPDLTSAPQGVRTNIEGNPLDMTPSATAIAPGITLGGLGLSSPFLEVILGFYMYYLPLALYAAWLSVATWDIVRRDEMKGGARIGWLAVVFLIPVLGPLAYFLFGRSAIQRSTRLALAIGAPLAYLIIAVLLLVFVS